jgi:metal-responsive CopG/Arc/MetJ family transcriptional regulator
MSTQIAVRLPDDLVRFLDETVREEHAQGRAAIVARALARERRRLIAERDARIYAQHGEDETLGSFVDQSASAPLDVD